MAQAKTPEGEQFEIHIIGDTTGKLWTGSFRSKKLLTFRDKLQADRVKRDLLGGDALGASQEAVVFATIIADVSARLTETPEWWQNTKGGLDLADYNVLEAVYAAANNIEKAHVKGIEEAGKKAEAALRAPEVK